jgi:hypothetical protein
MKGAWHPNRAVAATVAQVCSAPPPPQGLRALNLCAVTHHDERA